MVKIEDALTYSVTLANIEPHQAIVFQGKGMALVDLVWRVCGGKWGPINDDQVWLHTYTIYVVDLPELAAEFSGALCMCCRIAARAHP